MFQRKMILVAAFSATAMLTAGCHREPKPAPIPEPVGPNTLTAAERRDGWMLLFDGRTLQGWHTYREPRGVTNGWSVKDGAISRDSSVGDLVSDLQFSSFELSLEWRISPGGNSGVFYWANEGTDRIYENAPEMQVLDNGRHPDGQSPLTSAGALYALYPAPQDAAKPVGEWNLTEIVVRGSRVQHWLNGRKVVEVDFNSKEMLARIAASKFKDWLTFGKSRRGHIALQEHESAVWFRNIKIRGS